MNVNKVILVGRLTRDPEIRTTPTGQSVATIGMATNNFWTDKGGQKQEKTEFHTVILWGRQAEIAGQYLTKGQECFIEGRLQTREYTAKDGSQRRVTEVVGETMQLGSRAQGASAGSAPRPQSSGSAAAPKNAAPINEEEIPTINLDDEKEIKIEDVPF
ncbi:MAG: single-stranded DNA-binding protein [Candidatus Moraniibacteriota bacterium]|jgi:single-strand DNA-binding protein|nr:MAG: single-stranded DNA-binding protein [Candidatus Moranbacteria bacterium]